MNDYADKEAVFSKYLQRRTADVEIDGMKFQLETVSDLEKSRYDAEAINSKGKLNRYAAVSANARAIQLICKNPKFSRVEIDRLQELDSSFIERLAKACREHAGWDEEPEKNSDTTDSDDSPTS